MIRVILNGCNGRMGRVITELCNNEAEREIVAGVDLYDGIANAYPVFPHIGECGIPADIKAVCGYTFRCIAIRINYFLWLNVQI